MQLVCTSIWWAVECSDGEAFWCSSEIVNHSSSAFTSNVGSVDDVSVFRTAKKTPPYPSCLRDHFYRHCKMEGKVQP